jgi:urease subunit alpha
VLWPRNAFGVKPWMVIKGGFVAWAAMGDGNASQTNSEPIIQRPMWGALGTAKHKLGYTFVSRLAIVADVERKLGVQKRMLQIKNIRGISKLDMLHNDAMPHITVDSQTFDVYADGVLLTCAPAKRVPLNRRYLLR